jgi:hypothetical protein
MLPHSSVSYPENSTPRPNAANPVMRQYIIDLQEPNRIVMLTTGCQLHTDSPVTIECGSTVIQIITTSEGGINLDLIPTFMGHMDESYKAWYDVTRKGHDANVEFHRLKWIKCWVCFLFDFFFSRLTNAKCLLVDYATNLGTNFILRRPMAILHSITDEDCILEDEMEKWREAFWEDDVEGIKLCKCYLDEDEDNKGEQSGSHQDGELQTN